MSGMAARAAPLEAALFCLAPPPPPAHLAATHWKPGWGVRAREPAGAEAGAAVAQDGQPVPVVAV